MYNAIYITNHRDISGPSQVYVWDDEKGLQIYDWSQFNYAYYPHEKGEKQTIYGQRVKKVTRWSEDDEVFESDLPRETRCLTDLYLDSDDVSKNHRILFFDIEVSSIGGYARVEDADKPITAIGCYAKANDQYVVFLLDEQQKIENQQKGNEAIIRFDTERELLLAFLAFYGDYNPTVLVGYNSNKYDIPYTYNRLKNVFDEDTANMLSPIGYVRYSDSREQFQIAGVNSIDYYQAYRKFTYIQRPSYTLDAIGRYEVGIGKIQYDGTLDQLFEEDIEEFIRYNLRDVVIIVELDKELRLIDLIMAVSHAGHTPYEDYQYSSKFIEGTIVTYLHRQNKIVPDKSPEGRKIFEQRLEDDEEGFTGAYVKDPTPGLHEWVWLADINSLYPNLIRTLNISPESKIGKVVDWNNEKHLRKKIDTYLVEIEDQQKTFSYDEFCEFMQTRHLSVSSNGILYDLDNPGILSKVITNWFEDRIKFQELKAKYDKEGNEDLKAHYDRRQHVQKIFLNSIYGCISLPIFRFYDLDNALAVTASGQDVIKTSAKVINSKYQKRLGTQQDYCNYIDTDSLFFSAVPLLETDDPLKECIDLIKSVEQDLNNLYPVLMKKMFFCNKNTIRIKAESVNKTAFWVTKKRYAMLKVYDCESDKILDPPKFTVKGLDMIRSSFPPAFAEFTRTVINSILNQEDKALIDTMILDFKKSLKTLPMKDVARNTSVKKIESFDDKKQKGFHTFIKGSASHVKASIAYNRWLRKNKLDKQFEVIRNGSKVKYVYLKKNPFQIEAIAFKGYDDPPNLIEYIEKYIDHAGLFERELETKLSLYYKAMGWGLISTKVNQTASKFFK